MDLGHEDCNWDKEKLKDYLNSTFTFNVYFNEDAFDINDFSASKLTKVSTLKVINMDSNRANFSPATIKQHVIVDETSMVQLGFSVEDEYSKIEID